MKSIRGMFENSEPMQGFTMVEYLRLFEDPITGVEAATKRYADSVQIPTSVEQITGGPLSKSVVYPRFSGDIVGVNNTDVSLTPSGVTAGTYNRLTLNNKGRITSASAASNAPTSLPFNNIANKPTTTGGYVADTSPYVLKPSGASSSTTVDGNVFTSVVPATATHASTRTYLNSKISKLGSSINPAVGVMKISTSNVVGYGWVQANGGVLDKTTYASLYSVIGDTYTLTGKGYKGQPWKQQYVFNTTSSASITGWVGSASIPASTADAQIVVTKNRVYLIGGNYYGNHSSAVYTAVINADGTLGSWSAGQSLPESICYSQAVVTDNRIYIFGGVVNKSDSSKIYSAPINTDGTIGSWAVISSLPITINGYQVAVYNNWVYLIGGAINGQYSNAVYRASFNVDGTFSSWSVVSYAPIHVTHSQVIVTKDRIYMIGGDTGSGHSSAVCYTVINADGTLSGWTSVTSLPIGIYGHQVVVTNSRVFLIGGNVAGSYSNVIYTAPIAADGSIGVWTSTSNIPSTQSWFQAVVTNAKVHLIGGTVGGVVSSAVYTANFTGGVSDYMTLIANNSVAHPTQFKLPDYSSKSKGSLQYYIKAVP